MCKTIGTIDSIWSAVVFLLLSCLISNINCSQKINTLRVTDISEFITTKSTSNNEPACLDQLAYSPCIISEFVDTRFLRVNVHFMNTLDGKNNFGEQASEKYVSQLLRNANLRLRSNHQMNLPQGNTTENCQPHYQYVLDRGTDGKGIYHHYDDELCFFANKGKHRNNYDREVINKYAIDLDSVINIFAMPHIPKEIRSENYKPTRTGVALGNGLKIAGLFETKKKAWEVATLLNHEIGHILGLRHTWNSNDGCEDTPRNANCWASEGTGECELGSNNVMDYNSSQMAWTPCQLGTIHKSFNQLESSQRKLLIRNWCDKSKTPLSIDRDMHWIQALDINQDVIIKSGRTLTVSCRVHMAANTSITIEPGATLMLDGARLHNDCGNTWNGIQIMSHKKTNGELLASSDAVVEDTAAI